MNERLTSLLKLQGIDPIRVRGVSGGDINESFRVSVENNADLFVKLNFPHQSTEIISSEYLGMEMLKKAGVKMLPADIEMIEHGSDICLIMPFYEHEDQPGSADGEAFYQNLADMHRLTNEVFGGRDNFIGTLPQSNSSRNNWLPFFSENRLHPQFKWAADAGYLERKDLRMVDQLYNNLPNLIPIEPPSLIHGDLWQGNILRTKYHGMLLIDACPYYGHREMDLAMLELFSGVLPLRKFLPIYEEAYPLTRGILERLEIYQLYYLLAHLNMFGAAYLPAVRRIIQKFS